MGQVVRLLHTVTRAADATSGFARLAEDDLAALTARYRPEDLAQALRQLVRRGALWEPQSARPMHLRAEWRPLLQVRLCVCVVSFFSGGTLSMLVWSA